MIDFGFEISDLGLDNRRNLRALTVRNPQSAIRNGLTLVELLVVIIILTTLVGGVIPVLSPNNDERKIRAAGRGLQGYITLVQAEAARTGRPQGIAFQESSSNSGVALEVFGLEVPPPFAGFSTASYARVILEERPSGQDSRLWVQFVLADARELPLPAPPEFPSREYDFDPMPPNFVRWNDEVQIAGTIYRIVDTDFDGDWNDDQVPDDGFYTLDRGDHRLSTFQVQAVNATGQALAFIRSYSANGNFYRLTAPQPFQLIRQPTNSSREPYQLPAGIVIDLQGSVLEGGDYSEREFLYDKYPLFGDSLSDRDRDNTDIVGIMFSPTGAIDSVFHNGLKVLNVSRAVLLLGRIENGGLTYELNAPNDPASRVTDGAWTIASGATKDELEKKQEEVNWLNLDSRLVSIVAGNGRVVVSEPAFVDARIFGGLDAQEQAEEQIEAAHGFAHEMTTIGGN